MIQNYLIFTVKDKRYALPSDIISEVAVLEKAFPLPLAPDYVRGIINRYSVPYALIDISCLFFKEESKARKVIVLKEEVDKIALLIDDVSDIAGLSPENLMKTEQAQEDSISSFFEWKGSQVFCLDAAELINRIQKDFAN